MKEEVCNMIKLGYEASVRTSENTRVDARVLIGCFHMY